jgi:hypothetical protein
MKKVNHHLTSIFALAAALAATGLHAKAPPAPTPSPTPTPAATTALAANPTDNQLTPAETAAGWTLLFNGKDATGWRGIKTTKAPKDAKTNKSNKAAKNVKAANDANDAKNAGEIGKNKETPKSAFPEKGWEIKNGILTVLAKGRGGDIITEKRYSSFELVWDFQITPKANSGVKYFAQTDLDKSMGIGLEFQILDDLRHPDAKLHDNTRTVGGLYDLIAPAANKPPVAPGEWHTARLLVNGSKVAHYLDGFKTVEYDRHSAAFRERVRKSKYKTFKNFGEWPDGHILIQDHNDRVSYKNIKLRELPQ